MNLRCNLHVACLAASLIGSGSAAAQAPALILQPQAVTTYTGYKAQISVVVESPGGSPQFQWYLNGVGALPGSFTNIVGATNATLAFSQLTINNSGAYYAIIRNNSGAVTSAPANLVILAPPLPAMHFGEIVDRADGTVAVPIRYASGGAEAKVGFSVTFDGTVLSNPTFQARSPGTLPDGPDGVRFGEAADAFTEFAGGAGGALGVSLTHSEGRVFPAGEQTLGDLVWTLSPGRAMTEGRIAFTGFPTPAESRSVNNEVVRSLLLNQAPPILLGRNVAPRLDRQSGLYLQPLTLANPGNTDLTNARVTVVSLPVDSHTNQIVAYNALSRIGFNAPLEVGNVGAGATRDFVIEYFVPDHGGWPRDGLGEPLLPALTTGSAAPSVRTAPISVPLAAAVVRVTRQFDIPNAGFTGVLLDFPTRADRTYYIQYSPQSDFSVTNSVRLVLPPLRGTGSTLQWIDNGPPKTETLPTSTTARFYRVLEVR